MEKVVKQYGNTTIQHQHTCGSQNVWRTEIG